MRAYSSRGHEKSCFELRVLNLPFIQGENAMRVRAILCVCLLTAVAMGWLMVLGVGLTPATQAPRAAAPDVGRYQVLTDKSGNPVYLFDSATGQVWERLAREKVVWSEHIGPPKK
jgi:hypothetical protein